jgi:hypothetical protein
MGVDAGGDAFELAREMAESSEVQQHVTQDSIAVLQRAAAQAERYEARIAEQARLLGVQGKRITSAINALRQLEDMGVSGLLVREALEHLEGLHDG